MRPPPGEGVHRQLAVLTGKAADGRGDRVGKDRGLRGRYARATPTWRNEPASDIALHYDPEVPHGGKRGMLSVVDTAVFISFSHEHDAGYVSRLAAHLAAAGIAVRVARV
jgi:hypothetical protein